MTREQRIAKFSVGLHPVYLAYYNQLCQKLSPDWAPISGLRTMQEQAHLFGSGRTYKGPIVTNSAAGRSMHNYGLASDWGYFIDGKWQDLKFNDPTWDEYTETCKSIGLRTIKWEKPHNELTTTLSTVMLYSAYERGGMSAVDNLIRSEHGTS